MSKQSTITNPTCVICDKICENEWGNNPVPLAETGRCCDVCNQDVIQSRIVNITIENLRKELDVFVKLLNNATERILPKVIIGMNGACLSPAEVGEREARLIKTWGEDENTAMSLRDFLWKGNHKVNGKFNNWSCGEFGSRWADCKINGRNCRIAFYSRKYGNYFTANNIDEKYNYALILDPTL